MLTSLAQNLYVSGIPKDCTEQEIKEEFEQFGPVTSIRMNKKPSFHDKSKIEFIGSAYVCFEKAEDAKDAVYQGSMKTLFGRNIHIDYYKPKEFKKKEKVEEVGVAMKQMFHGLLMTAFNQSRGGHGHRGRATRGGYRGGRGTSGYTGYSGEPHVKSSAIPSHNMYPGSIPGNSGYARPPQVSKEVPRQSDYLPGTQPSQPPPIASLAGGLPHNVPPVSMGGVPMSNAPIGGAPVGTKPPPIGQIVGGAGPIAQSAGLPPPPIAQQPAPLINMSEISALGKEDKLTYIGEKIYPLIEEKYGENAPKITGMIIDMDEDDLLPTIQNKESLMLKAAEAQDMLMESYE